MHNDNKETKSPEKSKQPNHLARKIGALALAGWMMVAGTVKTTEWAKEGFQFIQDKFEQASNERPYKFSEETMTYRLEPGEGIWAAIEHIKGHEQFDIRDLVQSVKDMPENKDIKDLIDNGGKLQLYTNIIEPVEVTKK